MLIHRLQELYAAEQEILASANTNNFFVLRDAKFADFVASHFTDDAVIEMDNGDVMDKESFAAWAEKCAPCAL